MKKPFLFILILMLSFGVAMADRYFEGATDGTMDQSWDFNTTTYAAGDTIMVVDSTASAWGSYVLQFTDAAYTGLIHLSDIVLTNYTIEADIYIYGDPDANAPLYTGIGIKMAHDETKYYRFIFRNTSSSSHGQLRLQGYDGSNWHISQYWNPGEDFDSLKTGWHNFKIKVNGNQFWAYIDGELLPGCPYTDDDPFLTSGYPGIYKYNSGSASVMFDNFTVTTPDLFISEYIEGSSNNKALEIYNPADTTVSLNKYQIAQAVNGGGWQYFHTFPEGATIAPGDVWVIVADQLDPALWDTTMADEILSYPSVVHFNGDDARALIKIVNGDTLWLDVFGNPDNDPGSGWDVAGVSGATKDHTLVRKEGVFMGETDYLASFGTDSLNSEWEVYDQNTFDYLGVHPGTLEPPTISVTMLFNTSTNPDTLQEDGFVEIRGALNGGWETGPILPGEKTISWDNSSDLDLTNIGGDYWSITFDMYVGDTLKFKFWTGHDMNTGTQPGDGWEATFANQPIGDTRVFIAGENDTVVPVQYYNTIGDNDQYFRPYTEKQDTVAIYFRVNMAGAEENAWFDPAVNTVGVRGGPPVGDNGWSEGAMIQLTREENSALNGSFWSGAAYVPVDSITAGESQQYKFFITGTTTQDWESIDNRSFVYSAEVAAGKDTTIFWDWFNKTPYTGTSVVTSTITFRVSTEALEGIGLFDRGVGDKIYVIGAKGWDIPDDLIELNFIPALQEWTVAEEFTALPGAEINYKYFVRWDSSRVDSTSPNYIENLVMKGINSDGDDSGWEEPSKTGGGNRVHVFQDAAQQTPEGDFGFERQFFNMVPFNGYFETPMSITWHVNMDPATQSSENDLGELFRPGVDSVWIQFDGSLFALSQGFKTFNERALLLVPESEGSMIYTGTLVVDPPAWYQLGYVIVYKDANGNYIQNGGGFTAGRRYYQFIHPDRIDNDLNTYWPSTFDLPQIDWKARDLPFEDPPDLTTPTAIGDEEINTPKKFALQQNYPNPFNPSTTITYELAKPVNVTLRVYDISGRLIRTIVNDMQKAGRYEVQWDGKNDAGNQVASGMYFLRMQTPGFTKIRKMTLVR